MNHGKTTSAKWAISTLTERDRRTPKRIVLKNHSTAAELNIHLEDLVSTKNV
jgi:hypothetical protein